MAGQVGKLTLKAVIDGFEDVQGLGKALKDISEKAKKTDQAFEITTERIKRFGKATFKTNEGLNPVYINAPSLSLLPSYLPILQ